MAMARVAFRNLRRAMFFVARLLVMLTLLCITIGIPLMSWELYQRGHEPLILAWYSAGAFAVMGILISIHGIVMHLTHYDRPALQRYVVRILWMVPIYAIESWVSLRFKQYHQYLQIIREGYESFVIYSFLYFLISYLGEEEHIVSRLNGHPQMDHLWPMYWCCKPWRMGRHFLNKCKWGTLQYVLIMNVSSIVVWILLDYHVYHEGKFHWKSGYTYITIIKNFSQCWALYCLVLFYQATKDYLAPVHPLGKFICVKAVVFFSFWQSVFIALLVHLGYISSHLDWTVENVATGLQNFLICIEMFLASLAHHYAFSYKDFCSNEDITREGFLRSFIHSTIPTDLYQEMHILKKKTMEGHGNIRISREPSIEVEETILEDDATITSSEVSDEYY